MKIETVTWNWKCFWLTWGLKWVLFTLACFWFIWRYQIAEFAFLRYADSLGELSFPTLTYLAKLWISASLTVGSSWNFYSKS